MRNLFTRDNIQVNTKDNRKKPSFFLTLLLIEFIVIVGLQAIKTTYDNDLWWLLATGREIIQNGFPKTNPWAIHDGMGIIIQQWIPSVILYELYSLGDMLAVEIMLVIQIAVLALILWKLCAYLTEGKNAEWILLTILIAFLSLSSYFSSRPQIYTMMFYALLIFDLEKYRRTEQHKYLCLLPLITMSHVNFHASMAPLDIFIILLYLIPDIPCLLSQRPRGSVQFKDSSYARKPLLIATAIACVSMLVNPYGIRGALYLLESYVAADYRGFIAGMGETQIRADFDRNQPRRHFQNITGRGGKGLIYLQHRKKRHVNAVHADRHGHLPVIHDIGVVYGNRIPPVAQCASVGQILIYLFHHLVAAISLFHIVFPNRFAEPRLAIGMGNVLMCKVGQHDGVFKVLISDVEKFLYGIRPPKRLGHVVGTGKGGRINAQQALHLIVQTEQVNLVGTNHNTVEISVA